MLAQSGDATKSRTMIVSADLALILGLTRILHPELTSAAERTSDNVADLILNAVPEAAIRDDRSRLPSVRMKRCFRPSCSTWRLRR